MSDPAATPSSRSRTASLPGFVYLLLILSGPWAVLPYLGRASSLGFRSAIILASLAPLPALGLLPYNWLLLGLLLLAWNLAWGFSALVAFPMERSEPPASTFPRRLRQALAMAVAGAPMAVLLASLEQWLSDWLWSGFYPINASVDSISTELGAVWLGFGFLLFFSALQSSREKGPWTPTSLAGLILLVAGAHLVVNQVHLLLVTIPLHIACFFIPHIKVEWKSVPCVLQKSIIISPYSPKITI